ncbi:MAG: hypothetical protein NTW72_00275 [Gemmatimonadetes bacterium]|nr:hypothetical protein [Gemmatimonadota bacterium]
MLVYRTSPRFRAVALASLFGAAVAHAQQPVAWRFSAPDAAAAWFHTLDNARLAGPGALGFYRSAGGAHSPLARTLAASASYEILHFVPLYYPSATRAELARALREAAAASPAPNAPRAAFLVGALTSALPTSAARAPLLALADLTLQSLPAAILPSALARWQHSWDTRFANPLAPFLRAERLDGGLVMVADALGPEGRLFAGRPADRTDNVVAIGTFGAPPDLDAPVFALVRELCFPLVSRAADQTPALRASRAESARRTSVAAVRCGADLLDRVAPAEASAYRAHWQHAARTGVQRDSPDDFDSLFPPDPLLAPRIRTALIRSVDRP